MIKTPLSTVIGGAFWAPGATVIGGNAPTFDQQIQKLFANGEQGFFYDPNDLSTMYRDAYGQAPVTGNNQPVGLLLDKSLQLRVGDVINTTNEVGLLSISGTEAEVVPSSQNARTTTWTDVKPNSIYRVNSPISNRFRVQLKSNQGVITSYKGNEDTRSGDARLIRIEANTTQIRVYYVTGVPTGDFSLKLEEILGNHAFQSTSAARPILQDVPKRIDFDAVDDKLITNLPAQLTGCTVVRSVPNVGTQILTGQTIPATYEDNTDHCGLIVINRALTPSETSTITAELNKRAGI